MWLKGTLFSDRPALPSKVTSMLLAQSLPRKVASFAPCLRSLRQAQGPIQGPAESNPTLLV